MFSGDVRTAKACSYVAGRRDLLRVSYLQSGQLNNQVAVMKLRGLQRANRIQLHLAPGGVDAMPAVSDVATTPQTKPGGPTATTEGGRI